MMRFYSNMARQARGLAALGLVGALGACDGLLEVENPGELGDSALNDAELLESLAVSVPGQFNIIYDNMVEAGAILTDEAVNGHNFDQWKQFDLRYVTSDNSILGSDVYEPIQEARGLAEDLTGRMKELLGADASSDIRVARALAYGGYSYVVLGEYFCEAPVEDGGTALTSDQLLGIAIDRFDEAIAVAQAAGGTGSSEVINLARVGAARASLWLGDDQAAVAYASQVPDDFAVWVPFSDNTAYPNNTLQGATNGNSRTLGVDEEFRNLNDLRVRHTEEPGFGHNGLTVLYDPFQAPSHSEWDPAEPVRFGLGTDIRLASGLEARYIEAEAEGPTREFINERRAVGGQPALSLVEWTTMSEAERMAELREQRSRDFYLDGHRLGDLRRYLNRYGVDEFPSGPHPNESWGNYGDATCFIPHDDEKVGNPNY